MKLIIADSRTLPGPLAQVGMAIQYFGLEPSEVVSGVAEGVDTAGGEEWAKHHRVPITAFLPDWDLHGRSAGVIRNLEMAEYADALLAVWDGESRGTAHMVEAMETLWKPVYLVTCLVSYEVRNR